MGQRARMVKDRSKVKGVAVKRRNTSDIKNVPDVKKVVLDKDKKKN